MKNNINNEYIDYFVIFYQDELPSEIENLLINKQHIKIKRDRMTFGDYFKYINANFTDEIILLSNIDIYFDYTLKFLKEFSLDNTLISLLKNKLFNNLQREYACVAHP